MVGHWSFSRYHIQLDYLFAVGKRSATHGVYAMANKYRIDGGRYPLSMPPCGCDAMRGHVDTDDRYIHNHHCTVHVVNVVTRTDGNHGIKLRQ